MRASTFGFPILALAGALLGACGLPAEEAKGPAPAAAGAAQPLTRCELAQTQGVLRLAAHRDGVVMAYAAEDAPAGVELRRFTGVGCALVRDATAPIAADELLDVDDLGNVYAYPRQTAAPGLVGTMLEGAYPRSMVVKVDGAGHVSKLVPAGRGIWGFGVSPGGGSLWVTACGPTGILAASSPTLEAVLPPPETLWEQSPSVLTDDRTFWSIGYSTCSNREQMSPACGYPLVRSTRDGSSEVGTSVFDLGAGYQRASLVRCGERVCGVFTVGVIVWDDRGRVVQTLKREDLGLKATQTILQVAGNQHGVYLVLVEGDSIARVVFVPVQG